MINMEGAVSSAEVSLSRIEAGEGKKKAPSVRMLFFNYCHFYWDAQRELDCKLSLVFLLSHSLKVCVRGRTSHREGGGRRATPHMAYERDGDAHQKF